MGRKMSLYGRYILPAVIERTCAAKPIMKQREKVVPLAEGRVLEIGAGGGLNLGFFDRSKVTTLFGLDTSETLLASAEKRAAGLGVAFKPLLFAADEIPLADNSVDSVLVTYTLCSVGNVRAALGEMRRVLRPGGRLIFCEHGAAPDDRVRRMQHLLTPIWRRLAGNCHLDRDIVGGLQAGGFRPDWQEQMYLPGTWRFIGFNIWGVASKI